MLTELRVRNLALIAAAELELEPGLTVLSGETGAGKTALLSSLKLLIGERGDSTMVGSEGDEARVEVLFSGALEGESSLSLNGDLLEGEDAQDSVPADSREQEHLVVRRIKDDGRSRCYLDDSLVTVGRLSETLGPYVDLYGQHEHQSLLRAAEQLRILDEYAGEDLAQALASYQEALQAYRDAANALKCLQDLSNSSDIEREQAAYLLREVEKVAPKPGEYESIESELPRLQNGEQLAEAALAALEILRGEEGVLEKLHAAVKALEGIRGVDAALDGPTKQLESLSIDLEEIVADIGHYALDIEFDPEKLQAALDRLGELDGLCRRFGPGMSQVFAHRERSEQLLQSVEDTDEQMQQAEKKLSKATETLKTAAAGLAALRHSMAEKFLVELNNSIASLALTGANLEFSIGDLPFERWNSSGSQSFELLYRPAPGSSARPLAKIASGGELSRVMLAIKSLLKSSKRAMTLVFDEIDAGIGGATAIAVAERLAELSQQHQVIVITHLAQIAALADHHFLVSKSSKGSNAQTTITRLNTADRVKEIARMLSGSSNKEAIAHAEKLLKEAHQ